MDVLGYISSLNAKPLSFRPTLTQQRFFLILIRIEFRDGPFSMYKIFGDLEKTRQKLAYKNIREKIIELEALHLIIRTDKPIPNRPNVHHAKYFKISPSGWVFFWAHYPTTHFFKQQETLIINRRIRSDPLLATFLDGCLEEKTIKYMMEHFIGNLLDYVVQSAKLTITLAVESPSQFPPKNKKQLKYDVMHRLEWHRKLFFVDMMLRLTAEDVMIPEWLDTPSIRQAGLHLKKKFFDALADDRKAVISIGAARKELESCFSHFDSTVRSRS